jgi:hypothetical protein
MYYRREIVSIFIRAGVATSIEVTESRATVIGPFITSSALEQLSRGSGQWEKFRAFNTKVSSTSSGESAIGTFFFSYLGFREFSWLSLNILLHLTRFTRFYSSPSNSSFMGVSVKIASTLVFCLRFSLRFSAFGKGLISTGLT